MSYFYRVARVPFLLCCTCPNSPALHLYQFYCVAPVPFYRVAPVPFLPCCTCPTSPVLRVPVLPCCTCPRSTVLHVSQVYRVAPVLLLPCCTCPSSNVADHHQPLIVCLTQNTYPAGWTVCHLQTLAGRAGWLRYRHAVLGWG